MDGEFICKYCTAPLTLQEAVGSVVRCVHCGNVQTLPKKDVSPAALSFLRMGEHDLDTCKFDEAYTAYAKAAELDEKEPEAYFGMALAAFKVQYLKDEVNERLQPICHEISEKVFSDDKNFRRALELATDEQRREYRKRGREIDEVKEEFYELQRKGLDYDCFLCVKVTDGGGKTADYDRANDIYYYLKDEGYKPFFSEREMKGRTGSDYEALILYALYTSECMLIVCSNEEYLQTKWVKNEYMRFLHMLANEEKERDALTFVFSGKPIEKLPSGKKVQGIDLSKPDAYTRIGEFVKIHTPEAKKKREEEEARKQREEEERDKELAELKKQLAQMQQERATAATPANLSPTQLLAMTKQLEKEEARLAAEKKAWEEQKRREEEARLAAEEKAREEAARQMMEEEARKRRKLVELPSYLAQFEIENGVLKQYKGFGGEVVVPNGVASIGERAFQGCRGLTNVIIPNGVTSIGTCAFDGCIDLTGITIPKGVTSIGAWAFSGCIGMTSITIPDSVISIGRGAFSNCRGLTNMVIPNGVTSIDDVAFSDCSKLMSIAIPNSVTSIGNGAFVRCSKLKSVTISNRFKEEDLKNIFGDEYKHIKFTFI